MHYQFDDLKKNCPTEWRDYIEHSFVRQLGNASLAPEAFQHYLKQDYLFLIQFARAFALADVSPARLEQLVRIFRDATRLEIDFWDMGLNLSD